jgi:hypothetical protein
MAFRRESEILQQQQQQKTVAIKQLLAKKNCDPAR